MALRQRRRLLGQDGATRRAGRFGAGLFFLVFICAALLALSRLDHSAIREARWRAAEALAPVLALAQTVTEPVKAFARRVQAALQAGDDLARLRDENQRLQVWEWRARELERQLADLQRLAHSVAEQPISFVTARVLAHSSGPFVRSALVGAGSEAGIKPGYPAIAADGLVGRVAETGPQAARVMFVTDLDSRIPVRVGKSGIRAVLAGDNGPEPRLTLLPSDAEPVLGDVVATSGIGGLFPRGLRIGTVVGKPGAWRVRPTADLEDVAFVSVLQFETTVTPLADPNAAAVAPATASTSASMPTAAVLPAGAVSTRAGQAEPRASVRR